mmetsp:Transcript_52755/g.136609  ORF Transcript_52755/g.136609 Transcript_52755/m.136609 type:complete len:262 (+) Transcript_52755:1777-2562(+)
MPLIGSSRSTPSKIFRPPKRSWSARIASCVLPFFSSSSKRSGAMPMGNAPTCAVCAKVSAPAPARALPLVDSQPSNSPSDVSSDTSPDAPRSLDLVKGNTSENEKRVLKPAMAPLSCVSAVSSVRSAKVSMAWAGSSPVGVRLASESSASDSSNASSADRVSTAAMYATSRSMRSDSVLAAMATFWLASCVWPERSAADRKWRTYCSVWNPSRSAPSSPRISRSRIGSMRKTSAVGKGVCRNQPTRSEGILALSIVGSNMR